MQLSADNEYLLSLSSLQLHETMTQESISGEDVQAGKHTIVQSVYIQLCSSQLLHCTISVIGRCHNRGFFDKSISGVEHN